MGNFCLGYQRQLLGISFTVDDYYLVVIGAEGAAFDGDIIGDDDVQFFVFKLLAGVFHKD